MAGSDGSAFFCWDDIPHDNEICLPGNGHSGIFM